MISLSISIVIMNILRGRNLSVVFYGDRDLSMLHNHFSLEKIAYTYLNINFIVQILALLKFFLTYIQQHTFKLKRKKS
jgi:hypothetical protein